MQEEVQQKIIKIDQCIKSKFFVNLIGFFCGSVFPWICLLLISSLKKHGSASLVHVYWSLLVLCYFFSAMYCDPILSFLSISGRSVSESTTFGCGMHFEHVAFSCVMFSVLHFLISSALFGWSTILVNHGYTPDANIITLTSSGQLKPVLMVTFLVQTGMGNNTKTENASW